MRHAAGTLENAETCPSVNGGELSSVRSRLMGIREALHRYFHRHVGPVEADDLVQDVVVSLLSRTAAAPIEHFEGYAFGVASNRLRAFHKKRVRSARSEEGYHQLGARIEERHPEREAISREAVAALHRAIGDLPVRMRDAFLLSRFSDMTYIEIADHLGISVSGVEKHVMKALRRLAQALEPYL